MFSVSRGQRFAKFKLQMCHGILVPVRTSFGLRRRSDKTYNYQRRVDVDMLNTVKSVLADVSSVSPSSEQREPTHSLRRLAYPHQPYVDTLYTSPLEFLIFLKLYCMYCIKLMWVC